MLLTALNASIFPMARAAELREHSLEPSNGTWEQAVGARGLFLTQVIVSLVAVPLTLLAMTFDLAFIRCIEGGEEARVRAEVLLPFELIHLVAIPTAFIAAFAPHSAKWNAPGEQIFQWLCPTENTPLEGPSPESEPPPLLEDLPSQEDNPETMTEPVQNNPFSLLDAPELIGFLRSSAAPFSDDSLAGHFLYS